MLKFIMFEDLKVGDVFASFDNPEFMCFRKVEPLWDDSNTIDMFTGKMRTFYDGDVVYIED